jgi:hypothetical protein
MDEFLDEFLGYAQEILTIEPLTPEAKKELAESKTKKELIDSKVTSFLKRMGYSDQFIGMLWSFNIYGSLLNIKFNFPHIFNDKSKLKAEYQQSIFSSFRLLNFSLSKNHIKESLEDKFRIYYTMENYPPYQIDRRIDYLLFRTQSHHFHNIADILADVEDFAKMYRLGNLLEINNALEKLVLLLDSTLNPGLNLDLNPGLKPAIIEYLRAVKCSDREIEGIYPMIYDKLKVMIKENIGFGISNEIERILTSNIYEFRINEFLNSANDTLENMESEDGRVFQYIRNLNITDDIFYSYVNDIFGKKISEYLKENNNFTRSSVKEFLLQNKGLSYERFVGIYINYDDRIEDDPIINLETGESLDLDGTVLPNCALCSNILNTNIPIYEYNFGIKRLPCGGLFHIICMIDFQRTNGNICPVCGKDS